MNGKRRNLGGPNNSFTVIVCLYQSPHYAGYSNAITAEPDRFPDACFVSKIHTHFFRIISPKGEYITHFD
ncbi:MAG: hypothetical protein ACD_52C00104G0003 [uncultured bacterium]|nr:MAG: hypothetical protein ACD_52C00104G0003 [uncultured bacterium]